MKDLLFSTPDWVYYIVYFIFMSACLIILFQMIREKNILQKVLGLDLLTSLVMCFAVVYSLQTSNPVFLEISLCISIFAFLGTVAFAKYLGRKEQ